jgi:hypothetical protein
MKLCCVQGSVARYNLKMGLRFDPNYVNTNIPSKCLDSDIKGTCRNTLCQISITHIRRFRSSDINRPILVIG